jgi:hypothetical protein
MSIGVTRLRALARSEGEGKPQPTQDVSFSELKKIYSDMIRGPDPSLKLRAAEAMQKLIAPEHRNGFSITWDGHDSARTVRSFLRFKNGAAAIALCYGAPQLSSIELLRDIHTAAVRETPEIWDYILSRTSAVDRAAVQQQLNDPNWPVHDAREALA